ncbi:MAG: GNAT family N-acetyltransferase [Bacteroidetes bacterium]|nr:GNAT family N-acetyltransferase [Bacteroidota bacterium]
MNVQLQKWKTEDLERLCLLANEPSIAVNLSDRFPHPYTEASGKAFLSLATSNGPQRMFAIYYNNDLVGGIGLHPQEDIQRLNAEIGYWVGKDYRNLGIVSEAIQLIVEYGFKNMNIDRIFGRTFGRNAASRRVMEKSGFVQEAFFSKTLIKNGIKEDEYIHAIRRKEVAEL